MTEEALNRANGIVKDIKWANNILNHVGNNRRFSFRINTTRYSVVMKQVF